MSTAGVSGYPNDLDVQADADLDNMLTAAPSKKRGCPCVFNTKPSLEIGRKVPFKESSPRLYRFLVITAIVVAIAAAVGIVMGAIWGTVGFKAAGDWLNTAFSHKMSVLSGLLCYGATTATVVIVAAALYFYKRHLDKRAEGDYIMVR